MADEMRFTLQIQIAKGKLIWSNGVRQFTLDMAGQGGPTPDSIIVPTTGKLIYFEQLTAPGFCLLTNTDDENFVEYGIYDTITGRFHPLGELPPETAWPIYFSRNLTEQYTNSGTGTTAPEDYFMVKAHGAACTVRIEAFER